MFQKIEVFRGTPGTPTNEGPAMGIKIHPLYSVFSSAGASLYDFFKNNQNTVKMT